MQKINNKKHLDFCDVLILPTNSSINSRKNVNIVSQINFQKRDQIFTGIPIIAANMTTIGTFEIYNVLSKHKIMTAFHKFYKLNDFRNFIEKSKTSTNSDNNNILDPDYFMVSTGISDNDYNNLVNIVDNINVKYILIDIANGYINDFIKFCDKVRKKYPFKVITAGNVCTNEGIKNLVDIGIDIVKIGIGGGSACTTRIQTGIGVPQLSCILESKKYILDHNKDTYIISDGGITCPGDVVKAYGAGADFVMMGGVFSGHTENPGEIEVSDTGEQYKIFYGMSSKYSMDNNYAANNNTNYRTSEGRFIRVKYKGDLDNTVYEYLGGIRSACTYTNSANIKDLYNNVKFIYVNNQYNSTLIK